jgi:hypothetical protein
VRRRPPRGDRCRLLAAGLVCTAQAVFAAPGVPDGASLLVRPRDARGEVFSSVHYYAGSDWTAINRIDGDWRERFAPRDGRNVAVRFLHAEVGVARGPWRVSYLRRQEAVLETNRDTLELYYLEQNNLPVPVGRPYALRLYGNAFEAEGLKVARSFELGHGETFVLRTAVGASLLRGARARFGAVDGTAVATAPDTFAFNAAWTEYGTKKRFPFITPGSPEGAGYAFDTEVDYAWGRGNRLTLTVTDLWSKIAWRDLPATEARANSNAAARDPQGFIIYHPVVSGRNARQSRDQRLDAKTTLLYTRTLGAWTAGAGALAVRGNVMPRLGLDYRLGTSWRAAIERDFRFGATGVGLQYKWLSIAVRSERWDLDRSKAVGLTLHFALPL